MPDDELEGKGISKEDMQTPEQREAKAARLVEFRQLSDPTMERYWVNGVEPPFNLPKEHAVEVISTRRFDAVEAAEVTYDRAFFEDVQEVVRRINESSGQQFYLGTYTVWAIENQIALARGEDPPVDPTQVAYITQQLEQYFPDALGMSFQEWSQQYAESHKDQSPNPGNDKHFFDVLEDDYDHHIINLGNLTQIFREWAKENNVDDLSPEIAVQILKERRFVVPDEWNDEVAATKDGQELLEVLGKLKINIHAEEILSVLEPVLSEMPKDELTAREISASDVLAEAAINREAAGSWTEADEETKATVKMVLKKLAEKFGLKVKSKKGEPYISFKEK